MKGGKMEKRGQAAMEFLMTYGWAILAAIIVIAVLAIYFRPSALTTNSLAVSPPFYGVGVTYVAAAAGINAEIRNNGGEEIDIISMNATLTQPLSTTCSVGSLNNVPAGNSTIYTLTCGSNLTAGGSVQGEFTIYYTRPNSALVQQATGSLAGKVP